MTKEKSKIIDEIIELEMMMKLDEKCKQRYIDKLIEIKKRLKL